MSREQSYSSSYRHTQLVALFALMTRRHTQPGGAVIVQRTRTAKNSHMTRTLMPCLGIAGCLQRAVLRWSGLRMTQLVDRTRQDGSPAKPRLAILEQQGGARLRWAAAEISRRGA